MKELEGRTAIVTGASRGIGPQIARVLGHEGMNVVLVARSAAGLEQVAAELGSAGQHAIAVPADLSDHSTLDRIVEATEEQFGAVDLLVNNAGITATRRFETSSDEETAQIIDVNLTAGILLTKRVLPAMLERGRGHVVMIASLAGKVGSPYESVYAASKAGQIAFVQSLREELHGSGVGASVVCPGFVVESGMWADAGISQGIRQPRLAGATTPGAVASAVVRAVQRDSAEVYVNRPPMRPMLVLGELSPRFRSWVLRRIGLPQTFRKVVERAEAEARSE